MLYAMKSCFATGSSGPNVRLHNRAGLCVSCALWETCSTVCPCVLWFFCAAQTSFMWALVGEVVIFVQSGAAFGFYGVSIALMGLFKPAGCRYFWVSKNMAAVAVFFFVFAFALSAAVWESSSAERWCHLAFKKALVCTSLGVQMAPGICLVGFTVLWDGWSTMEVSGLRAVRAGSGFPADAQERSGQGLSLAMDRHNLICPSNPLITHPVVTLHHFLLIKPKIKRVHKRVQKRALSVYRKKNKRVCFLN